MDLSEAKQSVTATFEGFLVQPADILLFILNFIH